MAKPDEVILDFSQVRPFEPLSPKVRYLTRVTALDISKAAGGGPKSHCELTIEAPEEVQVEEWAADEEAEGGFKKGEGLVVDDKGSPVMTKSKGRKLFREFSLQPRALPFLYEFIKAVDPEAELDEKFRYNPKNYVGLQCVATINNEAFGEQVRPRVRRLYPASAYKE